MKKNFGRTEFGNDIDKNEKKKMREISRIVNKLYLYVFVVFLFFNNFTFFLNLQYKSHTGLNSLSLQNSNIKEPKQFF